MEEFQSFNHKNAEEEDISNVIQAKKEKFRVEIRAQKNKTLLRMKRDKISQKNDGGSNEFASANSEMFIQHILKIQQIDGWGSDNDIIQAIEEILSYIKQGISYHEITKLGILSRAIHSILSGSGKRNELLMSLEKNEIFKQSTELLNSVTLLLVKISYFCDEVQIKDFSSPPMIDALLNLTSFEGIDLRENTFLVLHNIVIEDKDAAIYLMDRNFPQEVLSVVSNFGVSEQMLFNISGIIEQIVAESRISFSLASEFLVGIDETLELICNEGDIKAERYSDSAASLFKSIVNIMKKAGDVEEDALENLAVQYKRICINLMNCIDMLLRDIQKDQDINELAIAGAELVGMLMSGNFNTTLIMVELGVFNRMKALLNIDEIIVQEQIMWSISNLFVFTNVPDLDNYLRDLSFWETILAFVIQGSKKVSKWGMVAVMNGIQFKDMEFIDMILEGIPETDLLNFIIGHLQDPEYQNVLFPLLGTLKALIAYGEYCMRHNGYSQNHIIVLIQRQNSRGLLEQQERNCDKEISLLASELIELIF